VFHRGSCTQRATYFALQLTSGGKAIRIFTGLTGCDAGSHLAKAATWLSVRQR
jgi:hypothetical protein